MSKTWRGPSFNLPLSLKTQPDRLADRLLTMTAAPQTVLIIEEDEATRHLYERALGAAFDVFAVAPDVTWETLSTHLPLNAVVIEPGPVDGPGWNLIREFRRHPETRATPIVLCTSQDDRSLDQELGVAAHLVKPVLPTDLVLVIRGVLTDAHP